MIVCYFGTYRAEYSRNKILIQGLRSAGVDVFECHEPLWTGIEDRVNAASGGWLRPRFLLRIIGVYFRLLLRGLFIRKYDVMVVGYPGQFDVYLARLLSWFRRKPLVWDIFMSIYLISVERGLQQKRNFTINLLKWVEKKGLALPDLLIMDTPEYVQWFEQTYHVKTDRFRIVPTGADNSIFFPKPNLRPVAANKPFLVLYYGTFIPNHGVEVMIGAARMLENHPDIQFLMVGEGPDLAKARQMAQSDHLAQVQFTGWLEKTELTDIIANADVCLGAFGTSPQSLMTVQNKIYECLSMQKMVITGSSPAVQRTFQHKKHLFICERNPSGLAKAILELRDNPGIGADMARQGFEYFHSRFSVQELGQQFSHYLQELCGKLENDE